MSYSERFEARKIKASKIKADDTAAIWRVYDKQTKNWYPKCPATNMYDATMVALGLNNGSIQP